MAEATTAWKHRFGWVLNAFLVVLGILMMIPFLWIFSTSLRLPKESFDLPPKWLPTDFRVENYLRVFENIPFFAHILNSLKVAVIITLAQMVTSSMAAFAFARLKFPGRNVLFVIFLASMMVPIQVTIVPIFVELRILRLLDTHWSLILPSAVHIFPIFLLRQFFLEIPKELEEAARIDGAGVVSIFLKIVLPLSVTGLSTMAIIAFNFHWNDFFRPLIFLNSVEKMTIPLGLVFLKGAFGSGSAAAVAAAVTIAVVPVFIAFLFTQRFLIEGITTTGLKG